MSGVGTLKGWALVGALGVLVLSTHQTQAMLLDEDFTGVTIADGLTVTATGNNLNTWIDFPNTLRWGITNGGTDCTAPCSGEWAQHLVQTSDNTNMLFIGLDASGLASGTTLELSFDFVTDNRAGRVFVSGLSGLEFVDPFAPFPFSDPNPNGNGDPIINATIPQGGNWSSTSLSGSLGQQYDVLVLGFIYGGTSGLRGVDNVSLHAVPEPASLGILGVGLVGLGLAARRRKRSAA